jgi:hypothetical protein
MVRFNDGSGGATEFDEFLWPLTDVTWPISWQRVAEESRLRKRLDEILVHVQETHVAPRLRRLGTQTSATELALVAQSVVSGPPDGPYWERRLHEPVPRALRDEWVALTAELRALRQGTRAGKD